MQLYWIFIFKMSNILLFICGCFNNVVLSKTRNFCSFNYKIIAKHSPMADKRVKKQEQQNRQRMEREVKLAQQHKDKMMPLVKFLKKHGLTFKYARVGDRRVEYFRFDDYQKLVNANREKIQKNTQISELITACQNEPNFIYYRRPADTKALKYPHSLQPVSYTDSQAKFCSFKFDTTLSRKWLMFSIVGGVLALVLFPVWPYALKYAIWLISLYLLIFLIGLLGLRLVIYAICVIAGFNVWLFPNLLGQYGFIQSFKPIFYAQRWQQSKLNVLIRIVVFLILAFYGVQLYLDPTFLQSHVTVTKSTIEDIHDWGVSKIKNEVKFSERAITNLEDILNETADVAQHKQNRETLNQEREDDQEQRINQREQGQEQILNDFEKNEEIESGL